LRVLITGIAGFSGSYLAENLLKQGQKVFGISKSASDLENLSILLNRVEIEPIDITDATKVVKVLAGIRPDTIYHLAAEASTQRSLRDPVQTVQTNVMGTLHILEAARVLRKTPCILLVSSAEVYGPVRPEDTPLKETSPLRPVHPYGFSKVAVHFLAYQYVQTYQLPVIEARSFSHIGPRQSMDFVVPDFAKQLAEIKLGLHDARIAVGDLSANRDFTDVRDVVRAYQLLAEKGRAGEVYHVCSGCPHSIQEILDMLISIAGVDVAIHVDRNKLRPVKMPFIVGSPEKIRTELGWRPTIPLRESLENTFEYWVEKIKGNQSKKTSA